MRAGYRVARRALERNIQRDDGRRRAALAGQPA